MLQLQKQLHHRLSAAAGSGEDAEIFVEEDKVKRMGQLHILTFSVCFLCQNPTPKEAQDEDIFKF